MPICCCWRARVAEKVDFWSGEGKASVICIVRGKEVRGKFCYLRGREGRGGVGGEEGIGGEEREGGKMEVK